MMMIDDNDSITAFGLRQVRACVAVGSKKDNFLSALARFVITNLVLQPISQQGCQ